MIDTETFLFSLDLLNEKLGEKVLYIYSRPLGLHKSENWVQRLTISRHTIASWKNQVRDNRRGETAAYFQDVMKICNEAWSQL